MTVKKLACSFAMARPHRACVCGELRGACESESDEISKGNGNGTISQCRFYFGDKSFTIRIFGNVSCIITDKFSSTLMTVKLVLHTNTSLHGRQVVIGEHRRNLVQWNFVPRFAGAQVVQGKRLSGIRVSRLRAVLQ